MEQNKFPTPHIAATPADIAPVVLMPGDPLRSKFIAENFLDAPRMFNNIRGVQGYTGSYRGCRVSVMASGMGIPSMGIYSYELYNFFGVDSIIRVGSAGSMQKGIELRDIILGQGACTNSAYIDQFNLGGHFAPIADFSLLCSAVEAAKQVGARYHVGNLFSADTFYDEDPEMNPRWRRLGVLAVEMEAAGLYINAARAGRRALAICTVSDDLVEHKYMSAEERQTGFAKMIEIGLETARRA